jgi:hypothetical protein
MPNGYLPDSGGFRRPVRRLGWKNQARRRKSIHEAEGGRRMAEGGWRMAEATSLFTFAFSIQHSAFSIQHSAFSIQH